MNKYAGMQSNEQKMIAIQTAATVEELDKMWAAWEGQGWSRDGQMYGNVLRRKGEISELSDTERAQLSKIERMAEEGASKPLIEGHFRR